jgi:phosphomannomutase
MSCAFGEIFGGSALQARSGDQNASVGVVADGDAARSGARVVASSGRVITSVCMWGA